MRRIPLVLLPLSLAARLAHAQDAADAAPEPWAVSGLDAVVHIRAEGDPTVDLRYHLHRVRPGWAEVRLAGPSLVVTASDGPVATGPGGLYAVLGPGTEGASDVTFTVRGITPPTSPGALCVDIPASPGQTVEVDAPGFDVRVDGAHGDALSPTGHLVVGWNPHVPATTAPASALLLGESAVAAWVQEGGLAVRARVRWTVARGEASTFTLDLAGLDEVEISGAALASWERSGTNAVLHARGPVRGAFAVEVTGRTAIPTARSPIPGPVPVDTRRNERFWTLGGSEDVELIPSGGPRSIALRAMPAWARGMSDTTPLAAWQGAAPLMVQPGRYEPVMGPDTVVESAEFVVATSAEGRELLRSTWLVRNERRQYLHVRPSDGYRPMTARVSGRPVSVLSDGDGGLFVPLEKSVETIQGLVSFPVEVTWIASHAIWTPKGERTLALPSVDAPIESVAWELHLPRDMQAARKKAQSEPVPVVYDPLRDAARNAWLNAMNAYKQNDFETAQGYLEEARQYRGEEQNISRLQSNLDVLLDNREAPPSSMVGASSTTNEMVADAPEDELTRRVRSLANAKTAKVQVQESEIERAAQEAELAGDDAKAADYWSQVVELADRIGATEQKESNEQADKKAKAVQKVELAKDRLAQRAVAEKPVDMSERFDADENTFMLDGQNVADTGAAMPPPEVATMTTPTTRTVTTASGAVATLTESDVRFGGEDTAESPEPVVVEATQSNSAIVVSEEHLVRVPVGRTYSAALSAAPGVTRGPARKTARAGKGGRGVDGWGEGGVVGGVVGGLVDGVATSAPAQVSMGDGELAPPPPPPPPSEHKPDSRDALKVSASPFTPALPLDGEVVRHADALLPAGAFPTFTIRYRTRPGVR